MTSHEYANDNTKTAMNMRELPQNHEYARIKNFQNIQELRIFLAINYA